MNNNITTRITALWAFSEAFLGGILHGFKVPFAGLALSLVAALCMSVLAVCGEKRGDILKATIAVLAVKFILSPHTPPMAYVAVLIEGFAGELFFLQRRYIRTGAFLLTLFCLLYSALQHLVILTIVFGKNFWVALDVFLNGITKTFISKPQHYSLYLVVFYLACYLLAGIAGGIMNIRIIKRIQSGFVPQDLLDAQKNFTLVQQEINKPGVHKKKKGRDIDGNLDAIARNLDLILYAIIQQYFFTKQNWRDIDQGPCYYHCFELPGCSTYSSLDQQNGNQLQK